jgi:hypothetical protein
MTILTQFPVKHFQAELCYEIFNIFMHFFSSQTDNINFSFCVQVENFVSFLFYLLSFCFGLDTEKIIPDSQNFLRCLSLFPEISSRQSH